MPTSTHEVLDLGELGHHPTDRLDDDLDTDAVSSRSRRRSWTSWLAVLAALLVGAAGGAYGWERWRVQYADAEARSAVELVASAVTVDYAQDDELALALRYRNIGEYMVVVRDVAFDTERLVAINDPEVLQIEPGASATHVVKAQARCPEVSTYQIDQPHLVVDTVTVDGTVRDEVIDLGLNSEVLGWLSYTCEQQAYTPTFGESYYAEVTTVTPSQDGTAVRAVVEIGVSDDDVVQIEGVDAPTAAFSVLYTVGDMRSSTSFYAPPITLVFRVGDCALARLATDRDMTPTVRGSVNDGEVGQLQIYPSSTLAAELVRLTERSCPA